MKSVSVIAEPTVIITESQRRAPTRGGFTEINAVITRYRVNAATGTFPCGALFPHNRDRTSEQRHGDHRIDEHRPALPMHSRTFDRVERDETRQDSNAASDDVRN
jgi:hypothetical protein